MVWCIVTALVSARPATAQQGVEGDEALEEEFALLDDEAAVVEAASRHQQDIGMSPAAITVITRQDIATSGADNLADLLRLVAGIDVTSDTPFYASISGRLSRSNENQHYLVLIDGREANDELAGTSFLQVQPIFLEDIERIEVINGPVSSLYGANALVGVISITTRAVPRSSSAWAQFSGGEPGAGLLAGRASLAGEKWGVSLSGGIDYSGSFADSRDRGRDIAKARLVVQGRPSPDWNLLFDCGFSRGFGRFATLLGQVDYELILLQPRLAVEAGPIKANLYYIAEYLDGDIDRSISLAGSHLADFVGIDAWGHVIDGDLQWDLPRFWEPLLLIVGARARGSWILSDEALGEGYDDPTSPDYHSPGVTWSDLRLGGFANAELRALEWLTLTASTRLDYDSLTGLFVSPRLMAVAQPWPGHFFRVGGARSFRKPSFQETGLHLPVTFPASSPLQGGDQQNFLEFMSHSVGNPNLVAEKLWALEAGYRLRLLEGRLWTSLEIYANHVADTSNFRSQVVTTPEGLPDLDRTRMLFEIDQDDFWTWGVELSLRYQPGPGWLLQAGWSHREAIGKSNTPKNLFLAGGRYYDETGLLGSLYVFTRSDWVDTQVENPLGILYAPLRQEIPNMALVLARLGYRFRFDDSGALEIGARLYLPVDLESGRLGYWGRGGLVDAGGQVYGGEQLGRRLTVYLEGTL